MKGKLLKDDMGWFVEYYEELGITKALPLYKEDVIKVEDYINNYHDDIYLHPQYYEGMDVEFEIRIDALSPTWEAFAILIHPEIPRLMYKGGKEIRSYHSEKIEKILKEIAETDEYAMEWVSSYENSKKWSNNTNEIGDNYGSFVEGFNKAKSIFKTNEVSEEEIDAAAKEMFYNNSDSGWHTQFARNCFKEGIKWYKSKLKNVDN
jgi:hypothetical protein